MVPAKRGGSPAPKRLPGTEVSFSIYVQRLALIGEELNLSRADLIYISYGKCVPQRLEERDLNSVKIVEDFWSAVWKAGNSDAAADFIVDDFVITTGGVDIRGKDNFIAWVREFLNKINDFHFEVIESFQNDSGSRVASLWLVTGKNNGMFGTKPNQKSFSLTGTAVWSVREDGKLLQNRVERAAWEAYQGLK
jgi:steroid delta-isomerase-like uncharacterized protein